MNIQDIELHSGIHTMYIISDEMPNDYGVKGITMETKRFNEHTGTITYGARVNPNKFLYDDNYISSYKQFCNTVDNMLLLKGITNYKIIRVDFRVDNYNQTFTELYKLNNIIVNLLALEMGIDCYESLKNNKLQNIIARSKGKGKEVECYDRIAKEGEGLTKCRLELRNRFPIQRAIDKKAIIDVVNIWLNHMTNKLREGYYLQLQGIANRNIVNQWNADKARTHIDLIAHNRDYIYTSAQMGRLCNEIGLAKAVAYTYKNRLQIKYYKYFDIAEYIDKITESLYIFLSS